MTATFSPDPAPALDPDAVAPAGTQTLMRGLAVVQAVAAGARDLKDICARIGVARSTTHRLASCLVQERYLRSLPGVGYVLGPKLIELGFQAREAFPMATLARPYLDELAALTGDTIHLAVRDNDEVLYLEKIPGKKGLEMRSRVGHRMPLAATGVGKALLLDAGEQEWEAIYEQQRHLLRLPVSKSAWIKLMRGYAQAGYAYDTGEDEPSIRCVAAPIRDGSRKTVAAISVSSTLEYMDEKRMKALAPVVCETARRISAELGSSQG